MERAGVRFARRVSIATALVVTLAPVEASAAPPSNDSFADRTAIASVPYSNAQSNVDATMEPSEATSACGFDSIARTVWYEFTPATDGWLQIDTLGSTFDTIVGVWTGDGHLEEVACNDDVLYSLESKAVFLGSAGTTYFLQIGGYGEGEAGDLSVTLGPPDAGSISGTVTSDSGVGLRHVCVDLVDAATDEGFSYTQTTGSGAYNLAGLPTGSYRLLFLDCDGPEDHLGEWYDDQPTQETADSVAVTSPSPTTGIDAELPAIRLTVSTMGGGAGTITSDPPGIDCGIDCDEVYEHGTSVTLTATPRTDSELAAWTGCDAVTGPECAVTVYEARTVEARFEIDVTPPDTAITVKPTDPSTSSSARFEFTATEPGSTFECSLDGNSFSPCTSPKLYSGLADQVHTFQVRATDPAGNTDPSLASYTWTVDSAPVDTTPPETEITSGPSGPAPTRTAAFEFVSSEPGSTFACSLDGSPFEACSSPASYYAPVEGAEHRFRVRATDPSGNIDPSPAERTWVVDAEGPVMSISRPTAGVYVNDFAPIESGPVIVVIGSVTVRVSASDAQSGVGAFRFDVNGTQVDPSQVSSQGGVFRFTFRPDFPGEHSITARATNGSGVTSAMTIRVQGIPT